MEIILDLDKSNMWKEKLLELNGFNSAYSNEVINVSIELAKEYLELKDIHKNELKNGIGMTNYAPPQNASRPYKKGYISELVLLGITGACGLSSFSYKKEKQGALIHNITPINKTHITQLYKI